MFIIAKGKAVDIIVENLQPLLICQNISTSASDILFFPQFICFVENWPIIKEAHKWEDGVKACIYLHCSIHPLNFCLKNVGGHFLKKVSPESLKLNIFSLCLSNHQRKGVAETCLTGWNIFLRKQLELSWVKGFCPIQSLDGSDFDKGWNWAWQFALPSRMIVSPKIGYV